MSRIRKLFDDVSACLTAYDVAKLCFLDVRNAREYLKILYGDGNLYISDWKKDGRCPGPWIPAYSARVDGDEKDAIKPDRRTADMVRMRKTRAKKRFIESGVKLDPLMAALYRDVTIDRL